MVVCRYFLEGRCRFGENCKFEHQRNDVQRNLFGQPSGSTTWSSKPATQTAQTQPQDLVLQLPREMDVWEKSKMWPFSCIAMEGETEAIPGFYDTSTEELRCEAYQGLKSGNMQPYIEKFKMLSMEFQNKRKELKNMPLDVKQKLVAMLEESRKKKALSYRPSMFGSSTSSNPFGQSTQGVAGTFGQPSQTQGKHGLLGQSGQSQGSAGLFGKPAFSTTPSATSSAFSNSGNTSSSVFGNSGNTSASVFGNSGNASNSSTSVFGSAGNSTSTSASVFGQPQEASTNPFASAGTGGSSQNLFGSVSSLPGSTSAFGNTAPQGLFGKPPATQSSASVFGASNHSSSSVFGSTGQTSSSTVFGSQQKPGLLGAAPSPFGSTQPHAQKPGLLGAAPTAFGPQTSSPGQQALFGGNSAGIPATQTQQALFGKPSAPSLATQPQSLFGKPLAQQTQPQPGLFGSAQGQRLSASQGSGGSVVTPGLFGSTQGQGSVQGQGSGSSAGVYTPLADLTEVEKAEFMAQAFTLGRIPIRPPARELINV